MDSSFTETCLPCLEENVFNSKTHYMTYTPSSELNTSIHAYGAVIHLPEQGGRDSHWTESEKLGWHVGALLSRSVLGLDHLDFEPFGTHTCDSGTPVKPL